MSVTSNDANLEQLSLTELMEKLDEIVAWFSTGEVDIDQATTKFDEGVKLAEVIKTKLVEAETKVNQIKLKLEKIEEE